MNDNLDQPHALEHVPTEARSTSEATLAPANGCLALRRRMMRLAESWECRAGAMESRGYRTLLEASLAESFRERAGELRLELEKPDNE